MKIELMGGPTYIASVEEMKLKLNLSSFYVVASMKRARILRSVGRKMGSASYAPLKIETVTPAS